MDTTKIERIRLGIFLLICFGATIGFTIFIAQQRLSDRKSSYHTIFSESVIGLSIDAKVMLNGIEVGNVTRIHIDSTNLTNVVVHFDVREGTPIKAGTRAQMTSGISLTGQKSLVLSGGDVNEPDIPEGGLVLAGKNIFNKLSGQAESTLERVDDILKQLNTILSENNAVRIENTLKNLEKVSANASKITQDAQQPMREIASSATALRKTLDDFQKAELPQKIETDLVLIQEKIQDIDTKTINQNVVSALESINNLSRRADLIMYNNQDRLAEILDQLNTTLSNLSDFAQKIKQNPSSLIRAEKKSGR